LGSIRLQYQRPWSAGSWVGLCGVAASESVAEEVSVDVGDVGAVLGGHRRELGVELGEEVDHRGPRWQADAGGVTGAVAGVVDRAHDDGVVRGAHQGPELAECLSDSPAHNPDDPSRPRGVAVDGE
jgi:hypothetical protein